jgi:hypothetical protein
MKKSALLAFALVALGSGCGSPCKDLGYRICDCQPAGSPRDNCKSQVVNVLGSENLSQDQQNKCEALLKSCADPLTDAQMCARLYTAKGKIDCGMAYEAKTAAPQ